ncbi:MAG: MYXO-CTERM sorting domain-containing protein [Myxococcota bacterium]
MRHRHRPPSPALAVLLTALAGREARAASGGPDALGYSFVDQDDGALYGYVDITATGTLVVMGNDQAASVPLGAPFEVYGVALMDMVATTNGVLTDDLGVATDFTNDCPIPIPPSSGAGFRIYALHDELNASVYYQYFTEPEASAVGYPGQLSGISVFQWTGTHSGGDLVDVEAILFHDDLSILTMVAADAEQGAGSTLGLQDPSASVGLLYACNTAMSVTPGVTAVLYTVGPAPDSDCCSASPTATPGCLNTICQAIVCDDSPSCCTTAWDGSCAGLAQTDCQILCGTPPPVTINEIRIDQTGPDNDEYFELSGPPGTPLDDIQYIVLGDTPTGELEAVIDLTGNVIPPSGLFVATEDTFTIGPPPDLVTSLNFENFDTVTHLLVGGLSALTGADLDVDADGVLDSTPWVAVLDTVSVIDPTPNELPYGPGSSCTLGPTCQQVADGLATPSQIYRCPDGDGFWQIGDIDEQAVPSTDTPGAPNACGGGFCGDGMIGAGETCDDVGESALCNANCTAAVCGDGIVNMTASELCDAMGESATCDLDCTPAICGDGFVNATAGELCDDMGESATCTAACVPPVCGDGNIDMLAGEECDDMGESAACDDDCTFVDCGDGVVNTTAGETCDDGGRSDRCDDDCTAVTCGDGVVNMTAGEECDGDGMGMGGPTKACDDDCTFAACGDGTINAAAGEQCDDAGESDTCDDDCTPVECGDGVANTTAGEDCDDGNTRDGDGCTAACTAEDPGTTGDPTDTGADETAESGPADSTDSGTTDPTSGSSTLSPGSSSTGPTETETETETATTGAIPSDEGCNCTAGPGQDNGTPWSILTLLSLGTIRRRRRRHSHGALECSTTSKAQLAVRSRP